MDATVAVLGTIYIRLGDSSGEGFFLLFINISHGRKDEDLTVNPMAITGN
jgi:hypothetical protein